MKSMRMTTALLAGLAGMAGLSAIAHADLPREPKPRDRRNDAERIAAAEAKRARKNAKRLRGRP